MIHRKRKEKGYLDRVVYGCHSDGEDFTFVQVDNESFVRLLCHAIAYLLTSLVHYERISMDDGAQR